MTKPQNITSQLTLLQEPVSLDLTSAISRSLAEDLKHPTKSRRGIADELSSLLGRAITDRQLENWTSPSHYRHRVTLDVVAAIYKVTGNLRAITVALGAVDLRPVGGKDLVYLDLSKKQAQRRRLDKEIEQLVEQIR